MARTDTLGNFLTDIADAIRTKKGSTETIVASEFDTEIENLPSGGSDLSFTDTARLFANGHRLDMLEDLIPLCNETEDCSSMFESCTNLTTVPLFDTSNCTNMNSMFSYCSNLTEIPLFDTSNCTNMNSMFTSCQSLSNESLNNILAMCINATLYTGTKTLKYIGFTSANQPASTIQSLSNYQNFINAGWTIGY